MLRRRCKSGYMQRTHWGSGVEERNVILRLRVVYPPIEMRQRGAYPHANGRAGLSNWCSLHTGEAKGENGQRKEEMSQHGRTKAMRKRASGAPGRQANDERRGKKETGRSMRDGEYKSLAVGVATFLETFHIWTCVGSRWYDRDRDPGVAGIWRVVCQCSLLRRRDSRLPALRQTTNADDVRVSAPPISLCTRTYSDADHKLQLGAYAQQHTRSCPVTPRALLDTTLVRQRTGARCQPLDRAWPA